MFPVAYARIAGTVITKKLMITFEDSGLRPELLRAAKDLGFVNPMPVQAEVIPLVLSGKRDIIALAQTGTGKTAAYGLPLIHHVDEFNAQPQVLVLCPTRELCVQVSGDMADYAQYIKGIRVAAIYGGASIDNQIRDLKKGVQIIVATPGRMNDMLRRKKVDFSGIHTLVLDEADEMLNMGFKEELNSILDEMPPARRTLLFSATMPAEVSGIASKYLDKPIEITIGEKNAGSENVRHFYYIVKAHDRYLALKRIVDSFPDIYGIIFCRTREETKDVAQKLMKDGYSADALHGDLAQSQRDYAMQRFRGKAVQMLVATDVAARGLDVDDLTHVINYNLPDELEVYTHRSGRTGRAGKSGISAAIILGRDRQRISLIEKKIKKKFELKQIPNGREVCEKQLFHMINTMEHVEVDEEAIDDFLPVIYKKLAWMTKEDVIKRFVSTEFNRFVEYYRDAPDLNVKEQDKRYDDRDYKSKRDGGRRGDNHSYSERKSHSGNEYQSSDRRSRSGNDRPSSERRNRSGSDYPSSERRKHQDKDNKSSERRDKRFGDIEFDTFRINRGSADGMNPLRLIILMKETTRVHKIKIGKVSIGKNDTIFEVDADYRDLVLDVFKDYREDGKPIKVKLSGGK